MANDFFSDIKKRNIEPKDVRKPSERINVSLDEEENIGASASGKVIKDIPLKDLIETQDNEFIFGIKDIDVDRIADDISENGFTGSIDVIDLHNGKYQIFVGHTRFRAVKKLGWETIPCTISKDMSQDELYQKLIGSNVLGRKMTPRGYARAIKAYKEKVLAVSKTKGSKRTNIAKFFGIAEGQVQRFEAINSMPVEIQDMCDGNDFPYTVLVKAVTFSDEQKQELLFKIKEYKEKYPDSSLSVNIVEMMINNIKDKETSAEDESSKDKEPVAQEVIKQFEDDSDLMGAQAEIDDFNYFDDDAEAEEESSSDIKPVFVRITEDLERVASSDFEKIDKDEAREMIKRCEDMIKKIKKML